MGPRPGPGRRLASLPHAGEGDGPASVRAALDRLRADRIGHGVRAVEDPALVERLADEGVPLEVCPSSNVCTRVVERLEEHPIAALRASGVVVTVNTDDPHMFGTDLDEEHRRLAAAFGWGLADIADLVVAGIRAALVDPATRRRLLAGVEAARTAARGADERAAPAAGHDDPGPRRRGGRWLTTMDAGWPGGGARLRAAGATTDGMTTAAAPRATY